MSYEVRSSWGHLLNIFSRVFFWGEIFFKYRHIIYIWNQKGLKMMFMDFIYEYFWKKYFWPLTFNWGQILTQSGRDFKNFDFLVWITDHFYIRKTNKKFDYWSPSLHKKAEKCKKIGNFALFLNYHVLSIFFFPSALYCIIIWQ